MSTVSVADAAGGSIGRVRVPEYKKIETPDLTSEATVNEIFAAAVRVARAERARRPFWSRKNR